MPEKEATETEASAPKSAARAASPKKTVKPKTTTSAHKNGAATTTTRKKATAKPKSEPKAPDPVERAEDTLDEFGKKLGGFLALASKSLRRTAAVAKEEFEDLWAEAQSIRRGDTK